MSTFVSIGELECHSSFTDRLGINIWIGGDCFVGEDYPTFDLTEAILDGIGCEINRLGEIDSRAVENWRVFVQTIEAEIAKYTPKDIWKY